MTKNIFTVLALIFFFSGISLAQEVDISGQIIDKSTHESVPYVHIINVTTNKGVVSNTEGRFWIKMDRSDTLHFSAIGFETYSFMLKEGSDAKKLDVTIELNTSTLELEAVDIFAYRNERALKNAILNMKVPKEEDKGLKIPGVRHSVPRAPSEDGNFSLIKARGPLTAIAKVFSKAEKERKILQKYKREENYQKVITSKFNRQVVLEITNIPEDKVEDFMEFCVIEESFIHKATEYEMAVLLKKCEVDFEKSLTDSPE